jgi:UPF0755 protein
MKSENDRFDNEFSGNDETSKDLKSFSDGTSSPLHKELKNRSAPEKKIPQKYKKFHRIVWVFMVVLLSAVFTQSLILGINDMLGFYREKSEMEVIVEIPKGANKPQIAKILKDKDIINDSNFFTLYCCLKRSVQFIPGSFKIQTNMDYEAIINHLQSNANRLDTDIVDVTIPEGKNVNEVAEILEENGVCSKNEFLEVCRSSSLGTDYGFLKSISNSQDIYYKLEGFLFPDTYKFYKDSRPLDVARKQLNNFQKKLKSKKNGINGVSIEKLSEEKDINIDTLTNTAALIQAEAANKDDMKMISCVINNRIKTAEKGGVSKWGEGGLNLLELDSTVTYPHKTKSSDLKADVLEKFKDNKYNTYSQQGLPPGPICNPGIDALKAVLEPSRNDYYYFCHSQGEKPKPYYAKTFAEHNKNRKLAGLG